jgi:hypothetical protein
VPAGARRVPAEGGFVAYTLKDFKQPRLLTPLLQGVLVLQIIATSCVGVAAAYTLITGQKPVLYSEMFDMYEVVRRSTTFWPFIVTVVALFWIYRVNKNTHVLSTQTPEFSPAWAVGWFFIPVANLVQPYLVVSELYNANQYPEDWRKRKRPWITGIWWTIIVITTIYSVAVRVGVEDGVLPPEASYPVIPMIALHQLLALIIYSRIAKWQREAKKADSVDSVF